MKHIFILLLLAVAMLAAWLGSVGFVRLRAPADRLHCVTFVNAVCGAVILLATLLQDGATDRVGKILLIWLLMLISGALVSHATLRAMKWRAQAR
ncbi:MAG TPA: monovalent cation/H(+) antiporter subunit G [Acidocella sp.]|nr:monovalent cation/H(+) antiporter subunit G [Acidocella sp.]